MNYLVDVVDRESLDTEYQEKHPKQWLVIFPSGDILYFDTEQDACGFQAKLGQGGL